MVQSGASSASPSYWAPQSASKRVSTASLIVIGHVLLAMCFAVFKTPIEISPKPVVRLITLAPLALSAMPLVQKPPPQTSSKAVQQQPKHSSPTPPEQVHSLMPVIALAAQPNMPHTNGRQESAEPSTKQTQPNTTPTAPTQNQPVVQLPSTDADYLQNTPPVYPKVSRNLGEQGRVLLRVLVGEDGAAREVQLKQSSGYERLDEAAIKAVRGWRFVPGKRNGVATAMWYDVPVKFELN